MKTFTIVRHDPESGEAEEIVAHRCPDCGNIVECQIDHGGCHWIHCTCGAVTKCGVGVLKDDEDHAEYALSVALADRSVNYGILVDCDGLPVQDGRLEKVQAILREAAKSAGVRIAPLDADDRDAATLAKIRDLLFLDYDGYNPDKACDSDTMGDLINAVVEHYGDPATYDDRFGFREEEPPEPSEPPNYCLHCGSELEPDDTHCPYCDN